MNLMFYDFNKSSVGSQMKTAQNFYKPEGGVNVSGTEGGGNDQGIIAKDHVNYRGEGDRVPTRQRGYRSAH